MSIIYEALKKTQNSINAHVKPNPRIKLKRSKFLPWVLFILFAISLAAFAGKFIFKNPSPAIIISEPIVTPPVPPPPPPAVEAKPVEKTPPALVLNGVFYSQDQAYALINNQIVKKGDVLDGAIVRRITLEAVELERDGLEIRLKPPR